MDTQTYTQQALRTESLPDKIVLPEQLMINMIKIIFEASEVLDLIKKGAFYKKQIDTNLFNTHINNIKAVIEGTEYSQEDTIEETYQSKFDIRNYHGLLGILTESGELGKLFLQYIESGVIDQVNLKEELGDINWYEATLCDNNDFSFEHVLDRNIEKLSQRYKQKFTNEEAINRDIAAEISILSK